MQEDIVVVKTRTGKDEEFRYDGAPVTIPAKKGLRVARMIAHYAIEANALRWDSANGQVIEAKVYIEDDVDTPNALPSSPITAAEIAEVKATDGLGEDYVLVEGKPVKKKAINLRPTKEQLRDSE